MTLLRASFREWLFGRWVRQTVDCVALDTFTKGQILTICLIEPNRRTPYWYTGVRNLRITMVDPAEDL